MMCGVAPDAPTATEANPTAPQERQTPKAGKNFSWSFFRKMFDVCVSKMLSKWIKTNPGLI